MLIFLQFSIGTMAVVRSSRHRPFCFYNSCYQKYATRISVCVIAVRKSQEFLKFVDFLYFFSTTTPTPSSRRVVIFSTTTQGIRLRRRVDVFSTTSDTNSVTSDRLCPMHARGMPKIDWSGHQFVIRIRQVVAPSSGA